MSCEYVAFQIIQNSNKLYARKYREKPSQHKNLVYSFISILTFYSKLSNI